MATLHNSAFTEPMLNDSDIEHGKISYEKYCA